MGAVRTPRPTLVATDIDVGQRRGNWTVIAFISGRNQPWTLRCQCGTKLKKSSHEVRKLREDSGCRKCAKQNRMKIESIEEWGINRVMTKYKRGAEKRGLNFLLTKEQFSELIHAPCYYCGEKDKNTERHISNSLYNFAYNGVDRMDSNQGYIWVNCFPACAECNVGKRDKTSFEFAEWIVRIMKYQAKIQNVGWLQPINDYLIENGVIEKWQE